MHLTNHLGAWGKRLHFPRKPTPQISGSPNSAKAVPGADSTELEHTSHRQPSFYTRGGGPAPMQLNMSPTSTHDRHNASDTMSPQDDAGSSAKRKSDDGSSQPRAKRNRYISIAWYGRRGICRRECGD
jgi:hypothetical protein